MSKDRDVFDKLAENEQHFIKSILAFFAASDGIVMENIVGRFMEEVKLSELFYPDFHRADTQRNVFTFDRYNCERK